MLKQIYEHLKTRKKYNTLESKYRIKCEELDEKIIEMDIEKRTRKIERAKYEDEIERLNQEVVKLKSKKKEKKENKDGK